MEKLIQALQIFLKYRNEEWPTHCEHDIMMIARIEKDEVSEEDQEKLYELGFSWNNEYDCYTSYRYGSA
jgi:hypothetical protein